MGSARPFPLIQASIASVGGVELLVRVLDSHAANADVRLQACGALRNMSVLPANQASIASAGGVERLVRALDGHAANADVVENACGALRNLSIQPANQS